MTSAIQQDLFGAPAASMLTPPSAARVARRAVPKANPAKTLQPGCVEAVEALWDSITPVRHCRLGGDGRWHHALGCPAGSCSGCGKGTVVDAFCWECSQVYHEWTRCTGLDCACVEVRKDALHMARREALRVAVPKAEYWPTTMPAWAGALIAAVALTPAETAAAVALHHQYEAEYDAFERSLPRQRTGFPPTGTEDPWTAMCDADLARVRAWSAAVARARGWADHGEDAS